MHFHELSIDYETRSRIDLRKCGADKYIQDNSFQIILAAFKLDNYPEFVVDLEAGEQIPQWIINALFAPNVIKCAHNAPFEIMATEKHFQCKVDIRQWRCTMAYGAQLSLPLKLGQVGPAIGASILKDNRGTALITKFCVPRKKDNFFTLPSEDLQSWNIFKRYCIRDVQSEKFNLNYIKTKIFFPQKEREVWQLDYKINRLGVYVNRQLVENAISIYDQYREKLLTRAAEITGLKKPNATAALRKWLSEEIEEDVPTLRKADIPKLLAKNIGPHVQEMLEIRQQLQKTSISKYRAILNYAGIDNRARGLTQYYGAQKTGRFAGRGVQMQNLPRNEEKRLEYARNLVLAGDAQQLMDEFELSNILSELIRTAFVPAPGKKFVPADYSAIEAVVLAWVSGEQWRLDLFRRKADIYVASASRMFGIPIEQITETFRQLGKVAELALGYQGGGNAVATMDKKNLIAPHEREGIKKMWRKENPNIVKFWYDINNAAIECVRFGTQKTVRNIHLCVKNNVLYVQLPSGRYLTYINPRLGVNRFGDMCVLYEGVDDGKWRKDLQLYGGLLTENIVQAIARDVLVDAMLKVDKAGYDIVFHVHDEIVCEVDGNDQNALSRISDIMTQGPDWGKDIPLSVKGFETMYYKK